MQKNVWRYCDVLVSGRVLQFCSSYASNNNSQQAARHHQDVLQSRNSTTVQQAHGPLALAFAVAAAIVVITVANRQNAATAARIMISQGPLHSVVSPSRHLDFQSSRPLLLRATSIISYSYLFILLQVLHPTSTNSSRRRRLKLSQSSCNKRQLHITIATAIATVAASAMPYARTRQYIRFYGRRPYRAETYCSENMLLQCIQHM